MDKPPPEVLALILADHVYHDDVSTKLFFLGVRSVIAGSSFPLGLHQLAAYAVVVEGRGAMSFQVRLTDADEEREPVHENEAEVSFTDPLAEVELIFDMMDLVFPEPGEYRLQLRANGQFLCERRLMLVLIDS